MRISFGFIFLSLICLSVARIVDAEDWPQFRGPTGQGNSAATNVPIEWSASKNVAWKVAIPGRGWSSPVHVGDRIYLTTAVGKDGASTTSLRAICLDDRDGKVIWDNEIFAAPREQVRQMHQKNSPASATPLIEGDRLYVHFGHMGTAALDLSGKVIWRKQIPYPPVHGNGGSPVLVGDSLIFNCDGASDPFVIALNAKTGAVKWKTPRHSPIKRMFSFATPLVIDVGGAKQVISPAERIRRRIRPGERARDLARPLGRRLLRRPAAGVRRRRAARQLGLRHGGALRDQRERRQRRRDRFARRVDLTQGRAEHAVAAHRGK